MCALFAFCRLPATRFKWLWLCDLLSFSRAECDLDGFELLYGLGAFPGQDRRSIR
jgi:hypothetical protein